MFQAIKFLKDYRIDHIETGNKHCKEGWVQVHCPFCSGSQDYHLGINLQQGYGNCWRCKGKTLPLIIQTLLRCSWQEVYRIIKEYGGSFTTTTPSFKNKEFNPKIEVLLPEGCSPLGPRHKQYIEKRGFDPDWIERIYGVQGTGPVGDYKHRVIAPILWEGNLVSYQGRDITGKSDLKYMACPQSLEAMDHKNTLYGLDLANSDATIVVEGIFDAWRLGPGAIGTFGTSFTPSQVRKIKNKYSKVFVLYDSEETAQGNARRLATQLAATGKYVEILRLEHGDPGEMKQEDANYLMKEIGL